MKEGSGARVLTKRRGSSRFVWTSMKGGKDLSRLGRKQAGFRFILPRMWAGWIGSVGYLISDDRICQPIDPIGFSIFKNRFDPIIGRSMNLVSFGRF